MTKLLDTTTGELVEIPASDVLAARESRRFGFSLDRPVPIIQNGEPKWIPAKLADQYRSSLTFTDDDTVFEYNAKERMSGIGGVLAGAAYGGAKGLTLGLSPLLMKAAGYGDLARDIELGAGNSALTAEVASLGFNPLAAFGRLGGKAAAKGAGLAAEHAGSTLAANEIAAAATRLETAAPAVAELAAAPVAARLGAGAPAAVATAERAGADIAPLRLGPGPLASGVADTSTGKALRGERAAARAEEDVQQRLLPARQIEARESPFTLSQPPFESELMTDIRNSRANTLDRLREVETQLSGKRVTGKKALLAEREALQGHLDEYAFMEMKFSGAEENALAEQAGRANVARRFGDTGLATGEIRTAEAGHADLELAAQRAEQARARNRMGQGAPDIIGRPAGGQGVTAGRELVLGQPRPGIADVFRAEQTLGAKAEGMVSLNARNAEAAAAETAAWREAGGTRAATQVERDIAAAEGVAPGRELAISPSPGGTAATVGQEAAAAPPGAALGTQLLPAEAGLPLPPVGLPSGVAGGTGRAAPGTGSSLLRTATEGAIYGGASQASREQLGLEEGSPGSVMKAALLGGGLSGAIHLGLNAASRGSLPLGGVGTGGAIGRGLKSLEDTHIMRGLGNTAADVKSMNLRLKNTTSGEVGSHFYVDEVKKAFAGISDLQKQFPDDVLLQSIPLDGKWSSMTAERKMAFTDAFKASLGPRYDSALNHINGVGVDESVVEAIVEAAKLKAAKGLEKTSLGSVNKVLNDIEYGLRKATKAFRGAADAAEATLPDTATAQVRAQVRDEAYAAAKEAAPPSYTIKDINKIKTELGKDFDDWSSKHGGEWTPVQMGVYNDFKGVVYDEAAAFSRNNGIPIHAQLTELDKLFMVAATMSKGVANDAAKKALQSPVGRDLLSQFALGAFAIGNPIGAALFAVGSAGLRGIYNSRGEGFIADMAAKLSRGVVANPQAAGAIAAQSIYSARRPVVLGYNAERLVDSEPKDYSAIVRSVRELNESRESVIADIRSKTSGLSPQEQTAAVDGLDKMMNDLAMNVPPGLSVPGQLSQQQKNYVVYAKSMLSPAYAVQVLVNGGTGGAAAAKALSDLGANGEGKVFLDTLAKELKQYVDESDDRKTAESAAAAYASIAKMVKSTTATRIHSKPGLGMPRPKLMSGPKAPVIKAASANRFVAGTVTVK